MSAPAAPASPETPKSSEFHVTSWKRVDLKACEAALDQVCAESKAYSKMCLKTCGFDPIEIIIFKGPEGRVRITECEITYNDKHFPTVQAMLYDAFVTGDYNQAMMALHLGASPNKKNDKIEGMWSPPPLLAALLPFDIPMASDFQRFITGSRKIMVELMNHRDFKANACECLCYDKAKEMFVLYVPDISALSKTLIDAKKHQGWVDAECTNWKKNLEANHEKYPLSYFLYVLVFCSQFDLFNGQVEDVTVRLSRDQKSSYVLKSYKISSQFVPAQIVLDTLYQEGSDRDNALAEARDFARRFKLKEALEFLNGYRSKEQLTDDCVDFDEKAVEVLADNFARVM